MAKLTDFQGEEALDLLADILEPATTIFTDPKVSEAWKRKEKLAKVAKIAIKNHKSEVIEILARLDGEYPKNYKVNPFTLPLKVIEIFNDPELMSLFPSQAQKEEASLSGSALEKEEK